MKKLKQFLFALLVVCAAAACNNSSRDEIAANDLKNYIDSVSNATVDYTQEQWVLVNDGYEQRMAKITPVRDDLSEAENATVAASERKYEALKARYETFIEKSNEKLAVTPKQRLRNSLIGEGKIGDDLSFSFVTADNALETYTNFVNAIEKNKDNYSREDWDEVKVLYEALDNRKNEIENDLSGHDNRQIALQKVKFVGLKATNRVTAKAEENKKSKE
jgi:hypothetical protein